MGVGTACRAQRSSRWLNPRTGTSLFTSVHLGRPSTLTHPSRCSEAFAPLPRLAHRAIFVRAASLDASNADLPRLTGWRSRIPTLTYRLVPHVVDSSTAVPVPFPADSLLLPALKLAPRNREVALTTPTRTVCAPSTVKKTANDPRYLPSCACLAVRIGPHCKSIRAPSG